MAVRSKRFFNAASFSLNAVTTAYTVPSGHTALVKYLYVVNRTAGALEFSLGFGSTNANAAAFYRHPIPANTALRFDVGFAVPEGGTLWARSDLTGALAWGAFGALLEGVASP